MLTRYWRDDVTLLSRDTKQILTFEQSHTEPILQRLKLNYKPSITANITFHVRLKAIGTFT